MKLYVIRHGQTDSNLNHIITSRSDVPLNETGIMQAKEAAREMGEISYDLVYCSPLLRTRQTMEIVNVAHKPVIIEERIIERNAGSIEGKYSGSLDMSHYWNLYADTVIEGAETIPELVERVSSFLNELKEKHVGETVVLVTHDGVCRAIKYYFCGAPKDGDMYAYSQNNAQIRMFEWE